MFTHLYTIASRLRCKACRAQFCAIVSHYKTRGRSLVTSARTIAMTASAWCDHPDSRNTLECGKICKPGWYLMRLRSYYDCTSFIEVLFHEPCAILSERERERLQLANRVRYTSYRRRRHTRLSVVITYMLLYSPRPRLVKTEKVPAGQFEL